MSIARVYKIVNDIDDEIIIKINQISFEMDGLEEYAFNQNK